MHQEQKEGQPVKQSTIEFNNKQADAHYPFVWKSSLYMMELYSAPCEKQQRMHIYSVKDSSWKPVPLTAARTKQGVFYPKKGSSCAIVGNTLFCFGGKDNNGQLDNRLGSLNLEKRVWKADFDLSNTQHPYLVPQPRYNANLECYMNRFLILYGGNLGSETETVNWLWIFDIEESYWHRVQNIFVPYLQHSTICLQDDKLYIIGNTSKFLCTQFLEIKIENNEEKDIFPLSFEKVESLNYQIEMQKLPEKAQFYKLTASKNKILLLFSISDLDSQPKTSIWIFDKPIQKWTCFGATIPIRPADIIELTQNNYFFVEKWVNSQTSIRKINISEAYMKKAIDQIRYKQWKTCEICYEAYKNQNTLMEPAFKLTKSMLETLTEKINFPLACFGIFAENALNLSATYINYSYITYKHSPVIKVEDDIRLNYTNEELEQIIVNFSAQTNFSFSSVDKRVRGILAKDFLKKQYGTNLKIAGLRLGSELLYISSTPSYETRVAYFTLEGDEYVCYYYAFEEKTHKTVDDYAVETKIYVQSKFGDLIAASIHENPGAQKYGQYKNTLYILNLRTVEDQQGNEIPELQSIRESRDILYISPNPVIYKIYLDYGCKINESIDVSLSTYLANLFIKNQHMKVSIQVQGSEKKFIKRQEQMEIYQKGTPVKYICPNDTQLKVFDLKLIELMFNGRLFRRIGIFHNGILIYHKNRLIKRYGCELGELLHRLEFAQKVSYGYFNIFGRIQIPDAIEVNQQKTDFVNQLMLQKLYTKINYLYDILQSNIESEKEKDKEEGKNPPPKQGPKLRSRADDYQLRQLPTKRIKRSEEDQSYNGI